jgi:hypothetical protein
MRVAEVGKVNYLKLEGHMLKSFRSPIDDKCFRTISVVQLRCHTVPTHQSNRQGCTLNWRWRKETLVVESHHNLGMERKDVPLRKQP